MKYSPSGKSVIADDGREFACDVWHPMPRPNDQLEPVETYARSGFWLVRSELPPIPKVKTRDELDEEAFWRLIRSDTRALQFDVWMAALRYERGEKA